MNEHDALIAGILAAPDSALPRLVYADWLTEHGDPERAEFIRVQCEIAKLEAEEPTEGRSKQKIAKEIKQLEKREEALFSSHYDQWFWGELFIGDLASGKMSQSGIRKDHPKAIGFTISNGIGGPQYLRWGWVRRGFIEEVYGSPHWLFGRGCPTCFAWRSSHTRSQIWQCPRCSTPGDSRGALADLRLSNPIRFVRLNGYTPAWNDEGQNWVWHHTQLYESIYAKLKGNTRVLSVQATTRHFTLTLPLFHQYATEQEAYDDLSQAILG